jgi:hypothetical protein
LRSQLGQARTILCQHLFKSGTRVARLDTSEIRQRAKF